MISSQDFSYELIYIGAFFKDTSVVGKNCQRADSIHGLPSG
jgi:hypothetical protein